MQRLFWPLENDGGHVIHHHSYIAAGMETQLLAIRGYTPYKYDLRFANFTLEKPNHWQHIIVLTSVQPRLYTGFTFFFAAVHHGRLDKGNKNRVRVLDRRF